MLKLLGAFVSLTSDASKVFSFSSSFSFSNSSFIFCSISFVTSSFRSRGCPIINLEVVRHCHRSVSHVSSVTACIFIVASACGFFLFCVHPLALLKWRALLASTPVKASSCIGCLMSATSSQNPCPVYKLGTLTNDGPSNCSLHKSASFPCRSLVCTSCSLGLLVRC